LFTLAFNKPKSMIVIIVIAVVVIAVVVVIIIIIIISSKLHKKQLNFNVVHIRATNQ